MGVLAQLRLGKSCDVQGASSSETVGREAGVPGTWKAHSLSLVPQGGELDNGAPQCTSPLCQDGGMFAMLERSVKGKATNGGIRIWS